MKILAAIAVLAASFLFQEEKKVIRVGAKHFTEGYILSEIISQLLEAKGFKVERKYNLGGTLVCFEALNRGEIDVYPEYTGTIAKEILRQDGNIDSLVKERYGLSTSSPYGFNNSYSLVLRSETNIRSISELKDHPELIAGISYEFLKRQDGWDQLASHYSLPQKPTGMEHGLAYQALIQNKIDITDCYTTDGEISVNNLVVLTDDKSFFPRYDAVSFYRPELPSEAINAFASIRITQDQMSSMNAAAVFDKKSFEAIAREFIQAAPNTSSNFWSDLFSKTLQHLYLTFTALVIAIIVAVPLGIWLYWNRRAANAILYIAGLLQTIPSIALLAIMIPLFGIGSVPAIVALFLYAILPILRNTVVGLRSVDPLLKEAAAGLGMSKQQTLKFVEGPLALPTIIAGIRIAAVINVGTATLAAFIGAGGLGEYIVTGLALNNTQMILQGAIPAAVLALLIEFVFEAIERPKKSSDKSVPPPPPSHQAD